MRQSKCYSRKHSPMPMKLPRPKSTGEHRSPPVTVMPQA
jgi:hypothetical protein